ncbi:P-loop containing nucleoside triphosphate hydrolase [Pseudocohnilembus persalinus]|uniref:p-loop containing nucleoside triphosphate hydrolase n=1 Tax=Pseudocohnilembus persalinus TaxID=266149 RepID=A0A0V0R069_PSEPJ|nr:P-loop containing nucleoside triphosphate hydrolase [Pseudocohnilembus persalinus]|eukprot:KRX07943.1 P-loop containing nucleoside triphosphate hydrolase [Pseudocohnilembus persalinus]
MGENNLNNLKVLFIDNIEILCKHPERIDFQQTQDILISNVMAKYLRDKIKQYPQIHFIITAQSQDHINEKLIKNLYENIKLIAPNYVLRKKFLENQELFQQQDKFDFNDQTIDQFANLTDNFTIGDFFTLFEQIQQILEINQNNTINKQEIEEEIQKLQNFSFKSASKFPQFEHVGGLNQTKESLKETFQLPIRYEFLFKKIDIKIPRGVFLYGPTGCGKTYMAQATANELGLNYLSIKGPELLNKYIGQSEQSVRDVFEKAQSMKPCIIFFDEFDAIVPRRNSGSTGVTDRVVNQFLTYLDGVASLDGVYILAASSRPELIDPALLRPGRLDKHLYVNFPDLEERLNILKIYGKELDLEGFTLEDIAQQTEFSTSADLVALLKELRLKLANELFENKTEAELQNINISDLKITKEFYEKVLKDFRRSLSKQEVQYQHQNYEQFQSKQPDVNKQKTTLY